MKRMFYPRLAALNMRRNARTYIPYLLTCVLTSAMYYIMKSLSLNSGLSNVLGSSTVAYTLELGTYVIGIFAFIFLFYTNSFLMKNRKKEFGLYGILGMEKKHLAKVIAFESLYTALISLIFGLLAGVLLDKLMYLTVAKLIRAEIALGFYISSEAVFSTLILFGVLFFLIFLNSLRTVHFAKPIELLKGGNVGEKEPKAKWLTALLGLFCLGGGYYMAVTTKNPVAALVLFFLAVILVIVGTYLLFAAGSVAFLKLLKKNKRYYYKTGHFIGVSGMIYRMRQNAVGLGNICILSTMVLVMISSTASLMIGVEDVLANRYPYQVAIYNYSAQEEKNKSTEEIVAQILSREGASPEKWVSSSWLSFTMCFDGADTFSVPQEYGLEGLDSTRTLCFITAEDYAAVLGAPVKLGENEVIFCDTTSGNASQTSLFRGGGIEGDSFHLFDETYTIKARTNVFAENGNVAAALTNSCGIVVRDYGVLRKLYEKQRAAFGENASGLFYQIGFDTALEPEEQTALSQKIQDAIGERREELGLCRVECREGERDGFYSLYGSLFFLGVFLGILFLTAAILIIYYKQISEGYDDKERFEIMQKVGMSAREVRSSIRSQILILFFLPLLTAGLHVAFAFPMIQKILLMLNLTNTNLYLLCTAAGFLIFALIYGLIYLLTAKAYYRIVRK